MGAPPLAHMSKGSIESDRELENLDSPRRLRDNARMKILLADDHVLFRAGLIHVLRQLDNNVEVIEAGTCADALALAEAHPDLTLALLDLRMPDGDGLNAFAAIIERRSTLPVVVLSASEKRDDMQRALKAGALGFIPKATTPTVMLNALRLVLSGGIYVPPEMIHLSDSGGSAGDGDASASGLTPRQFDVLARLIEGKTNKAIANELGLTEATVKAHVTAVFRALKVNNRTQAARAVETLQIKLPRS